MVHAGWNRWTPVNLAAIGAHLAGSVALAIPALTGVLLVMDALMGEQQRPAQAASGFVALLLPDSLAA